MFVCVSLSPAVDKRLRLRRLELGRVNRASSVSPAPGGKAAHVAMVLRTLGADPLWLGFAGGSAGAALVDGLQAMSIRVEAVPMENTTRVNLEIIEADGAVTEILEPGQPVSFEEIAKLQDTYASVLKSLSAKAIVILSGSLPQGVPPDYYATLIELGHASGCRVFLDSSGEPLRLGLQAHPDFVKPNQEEAEALSGNLIDGLHSAGNVLQDILRDGACCGAISLGAKGLVWRSAKDQQTFFAAAPRLQARSTVGCGDASLAGFAFAAHEGLAVAEAVRLAAACGAANCLADAPGRGRAQDIEFLRNQIVVEILQ